MTMKYKPKHKNALPELAN